MIYKSENNPYVDSTTFNTHAQDTQNPHSVTASQVGTYTSSEIDSLIASVMRDTAIYGGEVLCTPDSEETHQDDDFVSDIRIETTNSNGYALVHTPCEYNQTVVAKFPTPSLTFATKFSFSVESLIHKSLTVDIAPYDVLESYTFIGDSFGNMSDNTICSFDCNEVIPHVILVKKTTVPAGHDVVVNGASINYSSLQNVDLDNANVVLPDATSIATNAFVNKGVRSVKAPKLESIGDNAFSGCTNLLCVIGGCVRTIGVNVFYGCSAFRYFSPFASVHKNSNDEYVFDNGTTQTVVTGVEPSDVTGNANYPFGMVASSVVSFVYGDGCITVTVPA